MSKTATGVKVKNTKKSSSSPGMRKGTTVAIKPGGTSKQQAKKTSATLAGNDQEVGIAKEVNLPVEMAEAPGAEQLEEATHEIISSLPQASEKTRSSPAITEQKGESEGEPLIAHQANVAANKQRARQNREARSKARQETKETRQDAKAALGERYHKAAGRVSELRTLFISALDEKSRLLNVPRVGEAVPVKNEAIIALDIEIHETRNKLQELMARKREARGNSPELEEVNRRINDLRRQREAARIEKKSAFDQATSAKNVGACK